MPMIRAAMFAFLLATPFDGGLRSPLVGASDYATVPASPSELEAQVRACKLDLSKAAEAAAKATGGLVGSVEIGGTKGAPVYEIVAYGQGKAWLVHVDGANGEVKSMAELPRFPGDPSFGEGVKTPSGLEYFDLRKGDGEKPSGPSTRVKVHYSGWLLDGTPFDSSYKRNAPASFALNGVMAGWTEGVGGMQVGGKRKLIIPASLAFGDQGRPRIPGKATLVFDVELLEILK